MNHHKHHLEIIEQAQSLISIPSTVGNVRAKRQAINLIASILARKAGIVFEKFESNGSPSLLAYAGPKRPSKFDLLLNAHVDVVPASPAQFSPKIKDGRLYGRGAYDMKTAAIALTYLFCQHAVTSPLNIALYVVSDEETGGFDGAKLLAQAGLNADFIILGEMTDLGICNETRGVCWVEVGFKGVSAHGGYPWQGANAITRASDFAQTLLKKFPHPNNEAWTTTANIAAISTDNITYNKVPDYASLKVDFRFTPENKDFSSPQKVAKLIAAIDPEAEVLDIPVFDAAVQVLPTDPNLKMFLESFRAATGQSPKLIRRYGSSDARHFAAIGIPGIEFGLSGKNLHGDNEYVELDSIGPFMMTIEHFIQSLAKKPARARVSKLYARPY